MWNLPIYAVMGEANACVNNMVYTVILKSGSATKLIPGGKGW